MPLAEAAKELNRHCPFCNDLLTPYPYDYHIGGRDVRQWLFKEFHGCEAERLATIKAQAQAQAAARAAQLSEYEAMLKRAGLVGWLGRATFENYETRPDWPESAEVKSKVMAYCAGLVDGTIPRSQNWLILCGSFGGGKSHLAAAVVHEMLNAGQRPACFRSWPAYLERIKASWEREKRGGYRDDDGPTETESDIAGELQNGKVIVIDDLDKKAATEWTKSTLYSVINHRYNAELPTILTFNYGPGEVDPHAPGRSVLETYLGRAVIDRVIGAADSIIEFNGPSYRSGMTWGKK